MQVSASHTKASKTGTENLNNKANIQKQNLDDALKCLNPIDQ